MDYQNIKDWYDGHKITKDLSIYNHRSIVYALIDKKYDDLKDYIAKLLAVDSIFIYDSKEMPSSKSFTDLVFIPLKGKSTINVELSNQTNKRKEFRKLSGRHITCRN